MASPSYRKQQNTYDSFHSKRGPHNSLTLLIMNTSKYRALLEKENDTPPPNKSTTQQKLYSILNPCKPASPYNVTNRNNATKEQNINQSTNRINQRTRLSHYSVTKKEAVNEKIRQLMEQSKIQRPDSVLSNSRFEDKVKNSLGFLQKLNALEKEKLEIRNENRMKNEQIKNLENQIIELKNDLISLKQKNEQYINIEQQVDELEKYCNKMLQQNNSLKQKLALSNDTLIQQIIKDVCTRSKHLESQLTQLCEVFNKCNKLTTIIFNKEDVPLQMFMQQNRKKNSASLDPYHTPDSNLLSPIEQTQSLLENSQKISEIISNCLYQISTMLKKSNKTLEQISNKYLSSWSEGFSNYHLN